ncbi:MAG: formate dehydrogenase accessory protein FdhE, partial [Syntrophomonadaceae bacterium]
YITVENRTAYQIYTCDICKGYLKTFDERQNKCSIDMYIANLETIYLDMIAQNKGYTNHYRN